MRTNYNKPNPHMTPGPGVEPGPHWWEASALTTAPSLLPLSSRHTSLRGNGTKLGCYWFTGIHLIFNKFMLIRRLKGNMLT